MSKTSGVCLCHSGRVGGVAFFVPETYQVEITPQYRSFEVICILTQNLLISVNFICIYRPPATTNTLFDEFPGFFETTLQFQENLYMFSEFNIHLDLPSLNTRSFMDVLQIMHYINTFPTPISYSCSWSLAQLVYY